MSNFSTTSPALRFKAPQFGFQKSTITEPLREAKLMPKKKEADYGDVFEAEKSNSPLKDQAAEGIRQFRELMESIRADLEKGPAVFIKSTEKEDSDKIAFTLGKKAYSIRKISEKDNSHWEITKKPVKRFSPMRQFTLQAAEHDGKSSFHLKKGPSSTLFLNCESKSLSKEVRQLGDDIFKALKDSMPSSMKD